MARPTLARPGKITKRGSGFTLFNKEVRYLEIQIKGKGGVVPSLPTSYKTYMCVVSQL